MVWELWFEAKKGRKSFSGTVETDAKTAKEAVKKVRGILRNGGCKKIEILEVG